MRTLSHVCVCVCDLEMVNVLKNVNYKSEDICWFTKLARGWETRKEKASYGSDLLSLCSLYLTKCQNVGEYYLPFLPPFGKIIFYINSSLSLSPSLSLVLYAFIHVYVCMLNNDRLWIYGQVNFSSGRYFSDGNDIGSRLPFDAGFEVHDNNIINLWCNCLIQIRRFARPIMLCCLWFTFQAVGLIAAVGDSVNNVKVGTPAAIMTFGSYAEFTMVHSPWKHWFWYPAEVAFLINFINFF